MNLPTLPLSAKAKGIRSPGSCNRWACTESPFQRMGLSLWSVKCLQGPLKSMGLKNAIPLKGWAPRDGFFWDTLILKTGKIKYLKQPDRHRLNSFPFVLKHNFFNMPWACCESNLSTCFLSGECLLSVLISHKICDWYGPKASGKFKFYNGAYFKIRHNCLWKKSLSST